MIYVLNQYKPLIADMVFSVDISNGKLIYRQDVKQFINA